MNGSRERSDFRNALAALLDDMEDETSGRGSNSYQGAEEPGVLEHVTRRLFLDGLLTELGWSLGVRGDMPEEARVRADTTLYIDYMGVHPDVRTPLLIVEAKAWDVPLISSRGRGRAVRRDVDLLILTIEHFKAGSAREECPAALAWYDFVEQIAGYVRELRDRHGHDVPRVVLTSGQWMVIFACPTKTFLDTAAVDDKQIVVLRKENYLTESTTILDLLARRVLAGDSQSFLRPSQLRGYIGPETLSAAFHAIHVKYEATGSSRFAPKPRILVYPVVVLQRVDNTLLLAIEDKEFPLDERQDSIVEHLSDVSGAAERLLHRCGELLGLELQAAHLDQFPGFPVRPRRVDETVPHRVLVNDLPARNEWVMVTGSSSHYLRPEPAQDCRFHAWSACHQVGQGCGANSIAFRVATSPRSFFTDNQPHHCAHQHILDVRDERCHIAAIDSRTCCQACHYSQICWSQSEMAALPCGT